MRERCSQNLTIVIASLGMLGSTAAAGCRAEHYRVSVAPALRPVDEARPIVVFSQIQGKACGRDAVLGAIRDMKRLDGVDGYLEVVVEDTGEGDARCAKVTAYPFRYGESTDTPVVRAGEESLDPVRVPGRAQQPVATGPLPPPPPPAVDCKDECARVAGLIESQPIRWALLADRCTQRCMQSEPGLAACIVAATDVAAANACLTPAGTPAQPGEQP